MWELTVICLQGSLIPSQRVVRGSARRYLNKERWRMPFRSGLKTTL